MSPTPHRAPGRQTIRALALAVIVPLLVAAVPRSVAAPPSLALAKSDYPHGAVIAALPATNVLADQLLGPVHRSSFEALQRLDGIGWLQAAKWHFATGKGTAVWHHLTIFGYGINVFASPSAAQHALQDVRLKTKPFRVAHLDALLYRASTVHETLVFHFFHYRSVEVEAYYEYRGVAPASLAKSLHHLFSRQSSHLAHLARVLSQDLRTHPTPVPTATPTLTPSPTPTSTPTALPTMTPSPTPSPTATSTPRPLATPTASPTPAPSATPTPAGLTITATSDRPSYHPGDAANVTITVDAAGQPVSGANVIATFHFPTSAPTCSQVTNQQGSVTCSAIVPSGAAGTQVSVFIQVAAPNGESATASASFTIQP